MIDFVEFKNLAPIESNIEYELQKKFLYNRKEDVSFGEIKKELN